MVHFWRVFRLNPGKLTFAIALEFIPGWRRALLMLVVHSPQIGNCEVPPSNTSLEQGYLAHKKVPPTPRTTLGIVLL